MWWLCYCPTTYSCFAEREVSGSRFGMWEGKQPQCFDGEELISADLIFTLGWKWDWQSVEGGKPLLFWYIKVSGAYFLTLLHNRFTYLFSWPSKYRKNIIFLKNYFIFFFNRWKLLVTTALSRVSSLFGMYMDLVKYIPLMFPEFPVPSSKKSSSCFFPPLVAIVL